MNPLEQTARAEEIFGYLDNAKIKITELREKDPNSQHLIDAEKFLLTTYTNLSDYVSMKQKEIKNNQW